jgi:ribosomal-protein-alanine N-acetyltransferase
VILRPAIVVDAPAMAALHAMAFDAPWGEAEIAALIIGLGGYAFAAEAEGRAIGFILCRAVADEAEILTLATTPAQRRRGVAAALVRAGLDGAAARGASAMFLEVAADNLAAIGLYAGAGFAQVGARPGYYRGAQGAIDAMVMRRDLNI